MTFSSDVYRQSALDFVKSCALMRLVQVLRSEKSKL